MPVITVETWPLEENKKPELISKITEVFTNMGIPAQAVTIILKETQLNNWATSGKQHSVLFKDLKRSI